MVCALRDGLRGLARAELTTSLYHILAHLYLVDDLPLIRMFIDSRQMSMSYIEFW